MRLAGKARACQNRRMVRTLRAPSTASLVLLALLCAACGAAEPPAAKEQGAPAVRDTKSSTIPDLSKAGAQPMPDHSAAPGGVAWRQAAEFETVLAEAKAQNRHVMIDFWTSWCGPCKRMMKETFVDKEVVAATKGFLCVSIDAESNLGGPIAARYGISSYPTFVFLKPDGSPAGAQTGFKAAPAFVDILARVAKR